MIVRYNLKESCEIRRMTLETPCWLWQRSLNNRGYGKLWDGSSLVLAHRYSYEQIYGPLDYRTDLHHLCETKRCINPEHLKPMAKKEHRRQQKIVRGKMQFQTIGDL